MVKAQWSTERNRTLVQIFMNNLQNLLAQRPTADYHNKLVSTELIMRPGETFLPEDSFLTSICSQYAGIIAVDGVIAAPSFIKPGEGLANFDHHTGSHRLIIPSSARQLLTNLRMGGLDSFIHDGRLTLLVNDCDQDVGLCVAIAGMQEEVREEATTPRQEALELFTDLATKLDMTGGAYPCNPKNLLLRGLTWAFRPYTEFRARGGLDRQNASEYIDVIRDIGGRINQHLDGQGELVTLDTRHRLYKGGEVCNWKFVREIGVEGRIGAFAAGVHAYVIVRELSSGRWQYTFGRTSPDMAGFNIPGLYTHFNRLEACPSKDRYGGSPDLGGSPRLTGSGISPARLRQEINRHFAGQCSCPH